MIFEKKPHPDGKNYPRRQPLHSLNVPCTLHIFNVATISRLNNPEKFPYVRT